jgi:hypothetical protein
MEFVDSWRLRRHLEKKNKCNRGDFACRNCSKKFVRITGRDAHQLRCSGRQDTVRLLRERIGALQRCINISPDYEIRNLRPFGQESTEHLKALSLDQLRDAVGLVAEPSCLLKFIRLVRTNPLVPENHNVRMCDAGSRNALVYVSSERGWIEWDADHILRTIVAKDAFRFVDCIRDDDDPDISAFVYLFLQRVAGRAQSSDDAFVEYLMPLLQDIVELSQRGTGSSSSEDSDGDAAREGAEASAGTDGGQASAGAEPA